MNKIVGFLDYSLTERGTSTALFDYAFYNEKILGNTSIILYPKNKNNNKDTVDKFVKTFDKVYEMDNIQNLDTYIENNKIEILYIIKFGKNDGIISKKCKTVVHCVFDASQPHGNIYAAVSPWIKNYKKNIKWVPHMINLPEVKTNMREKLKIPQEAIVFGRYGGYEQFNIKYTYDIIYNVAKRNKNIYFLFANTKKFCQDLDNIIHLNQITNLNEKVEFINTCDAMLWGRTDGETFGLSIGEFTIKNKPIIATKDCFYKAHINLLKENALWYDEKTLEHILVNFKKDTHKVDNLYLEFTPEKVMKIFNEVYLQ
jgi:hypothetical protein